MPVALADVSEGEELTDVQIEELLQKAEARLREEGQLALADSNDLSLRLPKAPKLDPSKLPDPYVKSGATHAQIDKARLQDQSMEAGANGIRKVEDPLVTKNRRLEEKKATAGAQWYNLPKTDLTPELKRDLQLIKMRNVLDPHRHYKKENSKAPPPPFSQVGTLVEGPTEFFSSRLTNRERKRTLADEILEGERSSGVFKRKYNEIQERKTSGKRGHYNAQMAKKYKKNVKR